MRFVESNLHGAQSRPAHWSVLQFWKLLSALGVSVAAVLDGSGPSPGCGLHHLFISYVQCKYSFSLDTCLIFLTAAYMCSSRCLSGFFFLKEYEAIYLAKLTIKMMSPMQLGRSFSLQAGVAGLCEAAPFFFFQLSGVTKEALKSLFVFSLQIFLHVHGWVTMVTY